MAAGGEDVAAQDGAATISIPRSWDRLPPSVRDLQVTIAGVDHVGLQTCGDGACGLHALWGAPIYNEDERIVELRCPAVRERVIARVPSQWEDARCLCEGHMEDHLKTWIDEKYTDLLNVHLQEGREANLFGCFASRGAVRCPTSHSGT